MVLVFSCRLILELYIDLLKLEKNLFILWSLFIARTICRTIRAILNSARENAEQSARAPTRWFGTTAAAEVSWGTVRRWFYRAAYHFLQLNKIQCPY